jgi:hypothetical protein
VPWVKLDDQFYNHPKLAHLGPLMLPCVGLHVFALCWCNAYLTDGFIPEQQLSKLVGDLSVLLPEGDYPPLVQALVTAGLWEEKDAGYLIHDFLDYNPSRREVMQLRKTRARVGQAGGIASAKQRESKVKPKADQKSTPSPVPSPVPSPTEEQEQKQKGVGTEPTGSAPAHPQDNGLPDWFREALTKSPTFAPLATGHAAFWKAMSEAYDPYEWLAWDEELQKADAWVAANPQRKPRALPRFLRNWFERTVERRRKEQHGAKA